jgi:hypothetical protein
MTGARNLALLAFGWWLARAQGDVLACAACFGQSDSAMAKGMNMGIFSLLLVITSVLFGVAGFFVYLARRAAHLPPAQEELAAHFSQKSN